MMAIPTLSMGSRYRLLDQLGVGGMGVVYKAYDRLRDEVVALKHIHATNGNVLSDGTLAGMVLASEFRVLAGLRHPHIVSVLDYGFSEGHTPFYTMQLLDKAEPITIATRSADVVTRVQAVIEMLQALVYLHRRGIIHRDLKPTNAIPMPSPSLRRCAGPSAFLSPSKPPPCAIACCKRPSLWGALPS